MQRLLSLWALAVLGCCAVLGACRKEKLEDGAEKVEVPATYRLNTILFVNDTLGFIAGGERYSEAGLLTTRDGGNSWMATSFPEAGKAIYGMTMSPWNHLYLVGYDAKVLTSKDMGVNWRLEQSGVWKQFMNVCFADQEHGYVTGGGGFREGFIAELDADGKTGEVHWFNFELNDICSTGPQTGYACGYGTVIKTTDGWQNWAFQDIRGDFFKDIHFLDANTGYVFGYQGSIFKTDNGGEKWQRLRNGGNLTQKKMHFQAACFLTRDEAYAVGEDGLVVHTTNGWYDLKVIKPFTSQHLRNVAYHNGYVYVVGDAGTVYRFKR
jgi:photosystem II stability/assembly factor-like uncharacterized protein